MFIYVIVNSESEKLYIGQHKGSNLQTYLNQKWYEAHKHISRGSHLYTAMRKYPRETWAIYPLISGIETKAELDEWEQLLIYATKSQHPEIGYNICDGGEGFTGHHSLHTRAKLSAASQAMWNGLSSEERERRICLVRAEGLKNCDRSRGNANKRGKKMMPEVTQKCRENAAKAMKGKKHSPETLAKMRGAAKRRMATSNGKAQLADATRKSASLRRGTTHPPDGVEKIRQAKTRQTVVDCSPSRL